MKSTKNYPLLIKQIPPTVNTLNVEASPNLDVKIQWRWLQKQDPQVCLG